MDKFNHPIGKIGGFFFRLFRATYAQEFAITIGQTTYYSCKELEVCVAWRRHEDCHKAQFKRYGVVSYLLRYWCQLLRYGYWNSPFEKEARAAEK